MPKSGYLYKILLVILSIIIGPIILWLLELASLYPIIRPPQSLVQLNNAENRISQATTSGVQIPDYGIIDHNPDSYMRLQLVVLITMWVLSSTLVYFLLRRILRRKMIK